MIIIGSNDDDDERPMDHPDLDFCEQRTMVLRYMYQLSPELKQQQMIKEILTTDSIHYGHQSVAVSPILSCHGFCIIEDRNSPMGAQEKLTNQRRAFHGSLDLRMMQNFAIMSMHDT